MTTMMTFKIVQTNKSAFLNLILEFNDHPETRSKQWNQFVQISVGMNVNNDTIKVQSS